MRKKTEEGRLNELATLKYMSLCGVTKCNVVMCQNKFAINKYIAYKREKKKSLYAQ